MQLCMGRDPRQGGATHAKPRPHAWPVLYQIGGLGGHIPLELAKFDETQQIYAKSRGEKDAIGPRG